MPSVRLSYTEWYPIETYDLPERYMIDAGHVFVDVPQSVLDRYDAAKKDFATARKELGRYLVRDKVDA